MGGRLAGRRVDEDHDEVEATTTRSSQVQRSQHTTTTLHQTSKLQSSTIAHSTIDLNPDDYQPRQCYNLTRISSNEHLQTPRSYSMRIRIPLQPQRTHQISSGSLHQWGEKHLSLGMSPHTSQNSNRRFTSTHHTYFNSHQCEFY